MLVGGVGISKCICFDFFVVEGKFLFFFKELLFCFYWFGFMNLSSIINSINGVYFCNELSILFCRVFFWEGLVFCLGIDIERGGRDMNVIDVKRGGEEFILNCVYLL